MQENENTYALITGGSAGIGRAIAFELAKRGTPLLLVALEEPLLHETAAGIRAAYPVAIQTLGIDLCREDSVQRVYDWCIENNYSVKILVNNAGFGRGGLMRHFQLSEYYTMLALNNRAAVGLTYMFLSELEKHDQSYILILSSMEAALPLPYKAVYAGTKNFLYGYALALREELAASNISVSVICPGPTVTNESGMKRIKAQRNARLLVTMPEEVAWAGVEGMFKGKRLIIPGRLQSIFFRFGRHLPTGWKMKLLERISRNFINNPG